MEIKITSNEKPGFVFRLVSDFTGQEDEIAVDFNRNIETLTYLRALGIELADRGNKSVELQVSIWKSFPNLVDCAIFMFDLNDSVPSTGRVEITTNDGGRKGTRVIENAGISRISPRKMGTSCLVTFHILGGVISKSPLNSTTT